MIEPPSDTGQPPPVRGADREAELTAPFGVACSVLKLSKALSG